MGIRVSNSPSGSGGGGPYSSFLLYTALMSQVAAADPTVTVLQNSLSGPIVWTRASAGVYQGVLAGAFTNLLTWPIINVHSEGSVPLDFPLRFGDIYRLDANTLIVQSYEYNTELIPALFQNADDVLDEASLEIRVYP